MYQSKYITGVQLNKVYTCLFFSPLFASLALTPAISFFFPSCRHLFFLSSIHLCLFHSLSLHFFLFLQVAPAPHLFFSFLWSVCSVYFGGQKQTLAVGKGRLKRETAQSKQLLSADRTNLVGCYCKLGAVCPFSFPCVLISTWKEEVWRNEKVLIIISLGKKEGRTLHLENGNEAMRCCLSCSWCDDCRNHREEQSRNKRIMGWRGGGGSLFCSVTPKSARKKVKRAENQFANKTLSRSNCAGENEKGLKRSGVDGKRLGCCGWRGVVVRKGGMEHCLIWLHDPMTGRPRRMAKWAQQWGMDMQTRGKEAMHTILDSKRKTFFVLITFSQ